MGFSYNFLPLSLVGLGRVAETSGGHVTLVGASVVGNEFLHGRVEAATVSAGSTVNSVLVDFVVITNGPHSFVSKPPIGGIV